MSVVKLTGEKAATDRRDDAWRYIYDTYVTTRHPNGDSVPWRDIAIYLLAVVNDMPGDSIARAFGINKGNVSRTIRRVRSVLENGRESR